LHWWSFPPARRASVSSTHRVSIAPGPGRAPPRPHRLVRGGAHNGALQSVISEDFAPYTAAGQSRKVAATACMRKLLAILNALVQDNMLRSEKTAQNPT